MLVAPLAAGRADLVNGYRWPVPTRISLGAVLVAAIDRAVAVLPRVRWTRPAWGGSLAFTRNALAALDLPNTIGHALTEDCRSATARRKRACRMLTRRAIRPPTPLAGDLRDVWRFARRQYQLIRLYRPGMWCFAAFVVTTDLAARIALLSNAARLGARLAGPPRSRLPRARSRPRSGWRSAGNSALPTGSAFAWRSISSSGPFCPPRMFMPRWSGAVLVTSPVVWRHVRYVVDKTGQVIDVARRPYSDHLGLERGSRRTCANRRPAARSGGRPARPRHRAPGAAGPAEPEWRCKAQPQSGRRRRRRRCEDRR